MSDFTDITFRLIENMVKGETAFNEDKFKKLFNRFAKSFKEIYVYKANVDWLLSSFNLITRKYPLSEEFLNYFKDKFFGLAWSNISEHQVLSKEFIFNNLDKLYPVELFFSNDFTEDEYIKIFDHYINELKGSKVDYHEKYEKSPWYSSSYTDDLFWDSNEKYNICQITKIFDLIVNLGHESLTSKFFFRYEKYIKKAFNITGASLWLRNTQYPEEFFQHLISEYYEKDVEFPGFTDLNLFKYSWDFIQNNMKYINGYNILNYQNFPENYLMSVMDDYEENGDSYDSLTEAITFNPRLDPELREKYICFMKLREL
jgi:hypothetical protein